MKSRIETAYKSGPCTWLRGNLHTHTTKSDGPLSPQKTVDRYAELGYDFIVLTDHDQLAEPAEVDSRGLLIIPGNEITQDGPHILHVNATKQVAPDPDRQRVLDRIGMNGGFAVMCHPNWESHFNHCSQEKLEALEGYAGLEIFNGVVIWVEGNPIATDRWDMLLSRGRRVWGFADDDCHQPQDHGVAWNMVQTEDRTTEAVVESLQSGRFYASTGVRIETIDVEGGLIRLRAPEASRIAAFTDHGRRPAYVDKPEMEFTIPENPDFTYVRFECFGCCDRRAWTQPFFIKS